jgi:hypothetical protein
MRSCVDRYIHFIPPPPCKSAPSVVTNSNWLHNSTQSSQEFCYKLKCIIISKASNFWIKWQHWWESYECFGTLSDTTKISLHSHKSLSIWILDYPFYSDFLNFSFLTFLSFHSYSICTLCFPSFTYAFPYFCYLSFFLLSGMLSLLVLL